MAQVNGQADNHKAESQFVSQNLWGTDVRIDGELVRRNLQTIKQNIAPCKPRIIGVTKYYGLDAITAGYEAGLRDFGESRALDAIGKIENLQDEIRKNSTFHFIGHLQTNKAVKIVKYFDYIQSVDSLKLAEILSKSAEDNGRKINILLQVNNAGEEQKFGYSKEKLLNEFLEIKKLKGLNVCGLMNIAPFGESETVLRRLFKDIRTFRDDLEKKFDVKLMELSMGMSDDYEFAVSEGATMIRIGRKLFK